MRDAAAARLSEGSVDLYERIGAFLAVHGLGPEPAHYNFAYGVVTDPDGDLAKAVARLTEGGVRLSRQDIEALGGTVVGDLHPVRTQCRVRTEAAPDGEGSAERLVAETQSQVDGFATMMRAILHKI